MFSIIVSVGVLTLDLDSDSISPVTKSSISGISRYQVKNAIVHEPKLYSTIKKVINLENLKSSTL
jgi:hypothetical protein